MRIALIAAVITLMAVPAQAQRMDQSSGPKKGAREQQQNTEQQKQARQQQERDYSDALKRIPDKKPVDPWGKVR